MGVAAYKGDDTTGFQSPAQDHIEGVPDLADLLQLRRPQRYAVRVKGEGLRRRGIHGGDILVVTTDAPPITGKVCVAFLHGDVVLAVLMEKDGQWWLEPSNQTPQPLSDDTEVWAMIAALVRTDV
ncbi:S24 family peptidase [Brevundimonas sp. WCHBH090558]|uniref:LexA family protein n=1 Tax=Brevundimonas huaxiensis TaxID=2725493 RepID=UPI0016261EBE|nr:S24 family peptidase [Brevundimonas huaxiensis]MBC1183655.1 S24 family peptidase [Brevundimonas huaxiensis]